MQTDVAVIGNGFGARITALVLARQRLRVVRVETDRRWIPRTIALPESTIAELRFLGLTDQAAAPFRVPPSRAAPGRPESLWLLREDTLLSLLPEAEVPVVPEAPAGCLQVVAERGRAPGGWTPASTLHAIALRARLLPDPERPAHAFVQDGSRWLWIVDEEGDATTLALEAHLGATPRYFTLAHEPEILPFADVFSEAEECFELTVETGVDASLPEPPVLLAGSAQAVLDPVTSLGLRTSIHSAVRCALACRALLEGDHADAREGDARQGDIREWQASQTPLEAAVMLAQADWSHTPPTTGPVAADELVPHWARTLPRELPAAIGRKLWIAHRMKRSLFLDGLLQAVPESSEHSTVTEVDGRLRATTRLGCRHLGLTPTERTDLEATRAFFDEPRSPRALLDHLGLTPGRDGQTAMLGLLRLLEAGVLGEAAAVVQG